MVTDLIASEFAAKPACLVVHDPVEAGALDVLSNGSAPEGDYLFRSRPDRAAYALQYEAFIETLRRHVDDVVYLEALAGQHDAYRDARTNPNQIFTRDSIITLPWEPGSYIPGRMRPLLRRRETYTMETGLRSLGLKPLFSPPEDIFLEGGDVIPFVREGRRALLVGFGPRTSRDALTALQEHLIPTYLDEVIGIELTDVRINLDGGFVPVAEDVLVTHVESIKGGLLLNAQGTRGLDVLDLFRDLGYRIIEVTLEESVYAQACNCLCLGDRTVVYYDLCDRVNELLLRHDIRTIRIPGSELVKGRGGPRCMTRPIYQGKSEPTASATHAPGRPTATPS